MKRKILAENMHDFLKFTDDSDPIDDMKIGLRSEIEKWIREYITTNTNLYSITDDFLIDVYNTVTIINKNLSELPEYIKFNTVLGGFHCNNNKLLNMKGFPKIITGSFVGSWNKFKNVKNGPCIVRENYIISHCELNTLEEFDVIIKKDLTVSNNNLKSLKGIPKIITGNLYIHKNPIETLEYFPHTVEGDIYYTETDVVNEKTLSKRCNIYGSCIKKL